MRRAQAGSIVIDAFVASVAIVESFVVGVLVGASLAMMFLAMWSAWPATQARRRRR